ncbi:hypothetical protein NP233_g9248 [Leucocoprinus birnbaumii]|uniref:F-box domain-containing protein n=1 Tax=Leucocoprinus birnbaumii TaxID=56174 RepID=A0AAD5YR15_9AGAR|nr:hypothetical protein NP233_g9248 [Leucocoprinus birnbaumii]
MHLPDAQVSRISDHTATLPPEVLLTILKIVLILNCDVKQKLTIGAVCSRWRNILWSSPPFWSTFTDYFGRYDRKVDRLRLLELHIVNSRDCPMMFSISDASGPGTPVHDALFQRIFSDCQARIQRLRLTGLTPTWEAIVDHSRSSTFPQLEYLSLSCGMFDESTDVSPWFSKLPSLCELTLYIPRFDPNVIHSLDKITSLSLSGIHCDYAFYFLSLCQNLVEFRAIEIEIADDLPGIVPSPPLNKDVVLPHLTHFSWDLTRGPPGDMIEDTIFTENTACIRHIHLPSIRDLSWSWYFYLDPTDTWHIWQGFFKNISGLTKVEITTWAPNIIPELVQLFSYQPIQDLNVTISRLEDLESCVRVLTCRPGYRPIAYTSIQILKLSFLTRDGIPEGNNAALLDLIIEMLQLRRPPAVASECTILQYFDFVRVFSYMDLSKVCGIGEKLRALKALHDGGLEFEGWDKLLGITSQSR